MGIGKLTPFKSEADLVFIKTFNTTRRWTEVHIARKSSNYAQYIWQKETALHVEQNGYWPLVCSDTRGRHTTLDLVYIKVQNANSDSVKVHIVNGEG